MTQCEYTLAHRIRADERDTSDANGIAKQTIAIIAMVTQTKKMHDGPRKMYVASKLKEITNRL